MKERSLDDPSAPTRTTCLGSTCLRWDANGELAREDQRLVIGRLIALDRQFRSAAEVGVMSSPASA
ncbi:MAG: hypothetical protein RLZZ216_1129 [Cyanobacteriota bacterium]|jgi:hypothetical protein